MTTQINDKSRNIPKFYYGTKKMIWWFSFTGLKQCTFAWSKLDDSRWKDYTTIAVDSFLYFVIYWNSLLARVFARVIAELKLTCSCFIYVTTALLYRYQTRPERCSKFKLIAKANTTRKKQDNQFWKLLQQTLQI